MITIWTTKSVLKEKKDAADRLKAEELTTEVMNAAYYLALSCKFRRGFDEEKYLSCKAMAKELGELPDLYQTLLINTIQHYKLLFRAF